LEGYLPFLAVRKPNLLYYYAHIFLRNAVLKQWQAISTEIQAGPGVFEKGLKENFERLKEDPQDKFTQKDVTLEESDFSTTLSEVGLNKTLLLLVKFPTPRELTEVFYVGITLEQNPKYFTLELHRPTEEEKQMFPDRTNDTYKFCMWRTPEEHLNYGNLSEPTAQAFAKRIDQYFHNSSQQSDTTPKEGQ